MISTSMIDHSDQVLVCLGELCTSVDYSDVTFLVQNEQIPAHRAILAARSEYFRALLYDGLKESNQSKITLDVSSTAFKQLLRYIYTGSSELKDMEVDDILTLLGLVHQYGITAFVKAISDYLYGVLTVANVFTMADEARLLDLAELADKCYEFMDGNACSVIKHDSLSNLSFDTLVMVLGRGRFKHIEEIEIFQAVHKWCQNNDVAEGKKKNLYEKVQYSAIPRNNLLQIVRPTGVVNSEHLLNIISIQDGIGLHPYQPPPGKSKFNGKNGFD
ncbi:AGAP006870-PA [Anopheles gambiae str. PEST]|uniref:AGAP006870-PA n=1 Tax=Anopheles gambiae TaxID=7165 RepID=Q7QIH6_ANOGA|nr:AGAP006870-PA [Anopheles gambiae str. PEST]